MVSNMMTGLNQILPPSLRAFQLPTLRFNLTTQVIIGLLLGIVAGLYLPELALAFKPMTQLFLRMIKMLIAPLLFSTLVLGIANGGDIKKLGRMGFKTILYFEIATTLALIIGLTVGNVLQPGAGMLLSQGAGHLNELKDLQQSVAHLNHEPGVWSTLLNAFPTSVIDAMARGDILQVVIFSVFFGLAISAAGEKARPLLHGLESLSEIMFKFTSLVMVFAPLAVFAAIASTIAANGVGVLWIYAKLAVAVYLALGLFVVTVLMVVCRMIRVPLMRMISAIREPFIIAFSTASSETALPKAMEVMERFGVPKGIVGFVMPTGYSFNLDGSTLYLALATLFVAQMAGVTLTLDKQVIILLTLMLTSKGVAGVPRVSLVVLTGTLLTFGLPVEGVAVILGIDHFLDMGRTAVNLMGNCVATAVIARWEGCFDDQKMLAFQPRSVDSDAEITTITESLQSEHLHGMPVPKLVDPPQKITPLNPLPL